jgi:hypothetical protein
VPEFSSQSALEIAERLQIRGANAWIAVLAPPDNAHEALNGLRAAMSSLLQTATRILDLKDSTFDNLFQNLHQPSTGGIILNAEGQLTPESWTSLDLMRSAMERSGPIVLWAPPEAIAKVSEFAPNVRSFIGSSVFNVGPDGGFMTPDERKTRLEELVQHYGLTSEEFIQRVMAGQRGSDPHFIEWLVLLGRGDLV